MKNAYRLSVLAAVVAVAGAGSLATSTAQTPEDRMYRPPEATIYRDAAYKGPAVFIGEEKSNLGLAGRSTRSASRAGAGSCASAPAFAASAAPSIATRRY